MNRPGRARGAPAGRAAALARLLAATALLAGCAGLPVSGAIRVERTVPALPEGLAPGVRVLPPGPADKAPPDDIVRGFLAAQADAGDDYGVARSYLAPGTVWRTGGGATVYSTAELPDAAPPPARLPREPASGAPPAEGTVRPAAVRLALVGALDGQGGYRPLTGRESVQLTLRVVGGQWRITQVPAGLLLTTRDLQRSYQPLRLWWLGAAGGPLVPEIRWLPATGSALPTALVRTLLAGPSPDLAPAVATAIPPGTTLPGSATLVGTDVLVDLSRTGATVAGPMVTGLFQQLALTLRQVPTATGVRLTVGGQPLPLPGTPQRVDLAAADPVDPDAALPPGDPVAFSDGRLVRLDTRAEAQTPEGSGVRLSGAGLHDPAASPDGTRVAALRDAAGGQLVLLATGPATPVEVAGPGRYVSLSWDLAGELAIGTPGGLRLRERDGRMLTVPDLGPALPGPVGAVRLARDGVRVVLVAGRPGARRLLAGTLLRQPGGIRLAGLRDIAPGLADVTAVSWASDTELVVLGRDTPDGPVGLWQLASDGSQLAAVDLRPAVPGTPEAVTAGFGQPVLVAAGGVVYQQVGSTWRRLGPGAGPAYPG